MKRLAPAVVPPYGTPLKILMSSTMSPRIFPADVSAMTLPASAAAAIFNQGATCAPARKRDACFTKILRLNMRAIVVLLLVWRFPWPAGGGYTMRRPCRSEGFRARDVRVLAHAAGPE